MSRSVAPRTKSMRRDMLWLLSTSSTMSVSTLSRETKSIFCWTSSSLTVNAVPADPRRSGRSCRTPRSRRSTPVTSVFSTTSNGGRLTVSRSVSPVDVVGLHRDFALLERVLVQPLDGVRRTVLDAPTACRRRRTPTGESCTPGAHADLRDDADACDEPGASEGRGDSEDVRARGACRAACARHAPAAAACCAASATATCRREPPRGRRGGSREPSHAYRVGDLVGAEEVGGAGRRQQLGRQFVGAARCTRRATGRGRSGRAAGSRGAGRGAARVRWRSGSRPSPIEREPALLAAALEDGDEIFVGRRLGVHLVPDAAQKRLVQQVERVQVGREHDQRLERHLEFLAGLQDQMVDAAFERHDPAVQDFGR